jgi:hypothetical protein
MRNLIQQNLKQVLAAADALPYHLEPIGSSIDARIRETILQVAAWSKEELNLLAQNLTQGEVQLLGHFAEHMAVLAVRHHQPTDVEAGLLALAFYAKKADERDTILLVSVLFDALKRLGSDPAPLFETTSQKFGGLAVLDNYRLRQPEDQSIEDMGYEAIGEGLDITYRRSW